MEKPQSVTNLDISPEDERKSRMVKYLLAMSLRVVCIIVGVFVEGWLMWVCFAGAIFLPYFAVIIANASGGTAGRTAEAVVAARLEVGAAALKVASRKRG